MEFVDAGSEWLAVFTSRAQGPVVYRSQNRRIATPGAPISLGSSACGCAFPVHQAVAPAEGLRDARNPLAPSSSRMRYQPVFARLASGREQADIDESPPPRRPVASLRDTT